MQSRRDRKIRAAFKRQLYVPDPVDFADPWDDDLEVTIVTSGLRGGRA